MERIAILAVLAYLAVHVPAAKPLLTLPVIAWVAVVVLCAIVAWRNW